jgi:hypothetical protein
MPMQIQRRYLRVVAAVLIAWFMQASLLRAADADENPTRVPRTCAADEGLLPDTVQIDRSLRPRISVMLKRSPTFREQCRRVATTRLLYVRVHINGTLFDHRFRARTRILRFQSGVIIAEVELRTPWSPEEWIAHEFEHVLEQIERVPLVELADRSGSVWRTADDMFESERAIRAGRTVLEEIRRAPRARSDGFVE